MKSHQHLWIDIYFIDKTFFYIHSHRRGGVCVLWMLLVFFFFFFFFKFCVYIQTCLAWLHKKTFFFLILYNHLKMSLWFRFWFWFQLQCCGVNNYTDWYNIRAWPNEKKVPISCCRQPVEGCGELDYKFWFHRVCNEFCISFFNN